MIRIVWASLVTIFATAFWGTVVMVAAAARVRGPLYATATRRWARTILWSTGSRVEVHGAEHLSETEPQVVVSNHFSALDIIAQAAVLPLPFHFLGKKELNSIPFFGAAWRAAGHISLDRTNRQSARLSLQQAGHVIHESRGKVIIYPEGTRSRSGELQPFKRGAFLLAIEAQVPVVPTAIVGTYGMIGRYFALRPGVIRILVAPPIATDGTSLDEVDMLTAAAHERVQALLAHGHAELARHG
jgi:1-acyl-sn-glycerol-3-phosphate acyltransferase